MKVCVFGGTSLYRWPIYNQMAKETGCDFYISGDDPNMGIVTYDLDKLINFKGELGVEKRIIWNFTWVKGMVRVFLKPYDLFVIGGPFGLSGWIIILLSKFSKKKVASWSHGMYGRETGLRKVIKKIFFKCCDYNFVYNKRAKELMISSGIKAEKIIPVGNALDTDEELRIRSSLKKEPLYKSLFGNDYPVLIFVGRVIKDKRLEQVIQSMASLKDKGVYINFFVIGKDVDGVNLKQLAKDSGISDQVYMYGPCYDNNIIASYFYNASLCVSPGPIGLTATNAMTYGCPVVSHDDFNHQGPEFEAIIPGKTGDFFHSNDVKDLSNIILKWTSISNEDREDIRKNCFSEVDKFWNIYSETEAFKRIFCIEA